MVRWIKRSSVWLAVVGGSLGTGQAQVLFDGSLAILPAAQGWDYAALPGTTELTTAGGTTWLDTLALRNEQAGLARLAPEALDRDQGFAVEFVVRVEAEEHVSPDRAGFSVIVLDREARGIELGFWEDRVFAQADQPLFTHAEEALLDWSEGPLTLSLVFGSAGYRLFAEGEEQLSGPIRDYSAFTGFFDVYETPNFLFFGDDTTSAAARVELQRIALIRPPEVVVQVSSTTGRASLSWLGVAGTSYGVEATEDLRSWRRLTTVVSENDHFTFDLPASEAARFFRVSHP